MYVAAQRVISPITGMRGVNIFMYQHGAGAWIGTVPPYFLPDVNPGVLVWHDTQLAPPGNRVLSYLDIVAPDEMPLLELRQYITGLKLALVEAGNPTVDTWGPIWVRFGLGQVLPWRTELGALAGHLVLRLPLPQ